MFWAKKEEVEHPMLIYKGFVEEGPGQYPIKKTEDWVEDLGPFSNKMTYAARKGFVFSACWALIDIRTLSRITERRAQIARFCYYTIPVTSMAAGWMGGVEIAKLALGKDRNCEAHIAGATVPGAIWSVWRNLGLAGAIRGTIPFAWIGFCYAYAVKHNLYYSVFDPQDGSNPNRPIGHMAKDWSWFGIAQRGEYGTTQVFSYPKEEGPSWKKWDEEEQAKWDNKEWKKGILFDSLVEKK